jgi:hypothetical protein
MDENLTIVLLPTSGELLGRIPENVFETHPHPAHRVGLFRNLLQALNGTALVRSDANGDTVN